MILSNPTVYQNKNMIEYTYEQRLKFVKDLKANGISNRKAMDAIAIACGEDYDWYMVNCIILNRMDKLGNKTYYKLMERLSEITGIKII